MGFIDRLGAEPSTGGAGQDHREEMGPWLHDYTPALSIGTTHSIAGVGPRVADWPLIAGYMGLLHNWEYVSQARKP